MSLFHAGVAPALDTNANPVSGARWQFTVTGTTTPVEVYADNALITSLGTHVTADSAGRFADIYFDDAVTYRARLWPDATMTGIPVKDIDPANPESVVAIDLATDFDRVEPPASGPTATPSTTAGNVNGSTTYRVTFVTPEGETEGSPAGSTVNPTNKQVNLTNIPVSADSRVTARRIYRTPAGETATELGKLVGAIDNNTSTIYTDDIASASLGARLPWINTTGGAITIEGEPFLGSGFSTRLGVNSQPNNTNYATTSMGANSMSVAVTLMRSEAFGVDALQNVVSGEGLVGVGTHAGGALTSGTDTVAVGYGALQTATSTIGVVAIGRAALSSATGTATNLTAVGAYAAQLLTSGSNNSFFGYRAGYGTLAGIQNVAVGADAGAALAGGNFNSLFGYSAGIVCTGSANAGFGYNSLLRCTSGGSNVAVGPNSGAWVTTDSNLLYIDNQARTDLADSKEKALIYGEFNTTGPGQRLRINAPVRLGWGTPTVASLPAAAADLAGSRAYVTDSNAALTAGIGAVVAGGGANVVPVFCDGAAWRIG